MDKSIEKPKKDLKVLLLCGAVSSCVFSEGLSLIFGGLISVILGTPLADLNASLFGEALGTGGLKLLNEYAAFLGVMLGFLVCLVIVKPWRPYLTALGPKPSGNRPHMLLLGLLFGFACNAACVGMGVLTGSLQLEFTQFSPVGLLAFLIFIFIQSSTEEITARGFIYQRVCRTYGEWPAIIISAAAFAFMHIFNDGISLVPMINLLLIGMLYALMVRYCDSIWLAMGAHTAWNLTQNIIFGLPNSGTPSTYSFFSLVGTSTNGFAYDTVFGVEGSVFAALLNLACVVALIWWGRKHDKGQYDIWAGTEVEAADETPKTHWFY